MLTANQSRVREELTDGGKAFDRMDLIQQRHRDDSAYSRNRLKEEEVIGIVHLGGSLKIDLQVLDMLVVLCEQSKIGFDRVAHGGISNASATPARLLAYCSFLVGGKLSWLVVRVRYVGECLSAPAHQVHASPEKIAGAAPGGWIGVSHWEVSAAQQIGELLRVELVVLHLASVDGFQVQGVPKTKGIFSASQRSHSQYQLKVDSQRRPYSGDRVRSARES